MQNMAPVGEIKTVTLTQKRIMEECESVLCRSQKPTDAELPSSGSGYRKGWYGGGTSNSTHLQQTDNNLTSIGQCVQ